jgi:hypothetical protein
VVETSSWWFASGLNWAAIWFDLEPFTLLLYGFWLMLILLEAHHIPTFAGRSRASKERNRCTK